jgi:hypothetical protein
MSVYILEDDVPIPPRKASSMWDACPLLTMKVGQSFLVTTPMGKAPSRMSALRTWIGKHKNPAYQARFFQFRAFNGGEFRVWRVE